jgi:hypothetical protein
MINEMIGNWPANAILRGVLMWIPEYQASHTRIELKIIRFFYFMGIFTPDLRAKSMASG